MYLNRCPGQEGLNGNKGLGTPDLLKLLHLQHLSSWVYPAESCAERLPRGVCHATQVGRKACRESTGSTQDWVVHKLICEAAIP